MNSPNPRLAAATLPIMQETGKELRRLLDLHSTRHPQLRDLLLSDPAAAVAVFRALDRARPGALMLMPGATEAADADDDIPTMHDGRTRLLERSSTVAPDLNRTLAELMRRIRAEAGAARVVFAMLSQERDRLRTRLAIGGSADDDLRSLDLDLGQEQLFTLLMRKPQSLWLHSGNTAKYLAYLPPSLRQLLAPEGAYLMSLFVGDKPLGLMYADGGGLSEQGYRPFRELCNEATTLLTAGNRVALRPRA